MTARGLDRAGVPALQRVAGTPVVRAQDDDRPRLLIVSDLHVDRDDIEVAEAFSGVCELAAADPTTTRLFVLGDLFEVFVGPGQLDLGCWQTVADGLRYAVDRGVSVTVLHGNRDFLLDGRFARRVGCRVVAGGLRFRLPDGRAAVAMHGDEFCLNDDPYQRSKRWLRSRAVRSLMRAMPLRLGLRLGGAAREKSRQSGAETAAEVAGGDRVIGVDGQPTDEPMRYAPVREAVAESYRDGVEFLVFGHIHRAARGRFPRDGDGRVEEAEYCVLPAFDSNRTFLEADEDGVRYRTLEARSIRDPGPRTFPTRRGSAP